MSGAGTAGEVVRRAIADSVARLERAEPVVRAGRDPEGVHQARVATRRLRSDLRTFRPCLDLEWSEPLRDDLHGLADALGRVRDGDVMLQRLETAAAALPLDDQPGTAPLLRHLRDGRDAAHAQLLSLLDTPAQAGLRDRIREAADRPRLRDADGSATAVLPPRAERAWRRLVRTVRLAGAEPDDSVLHQVRIAAKRARYAAEAVIPVSGRPARKLARELAGLQEVLGEHHDAVVAQAWLRQRASEGVGDAVAAGQLIALERLAAQRQREAWPRVWRAVRRAHPQSWV